MADEEKIKILKARCGECYGLPDDKVIEEHDNCHGWFHCHPEDCSCGSCDYCEITSIFIDSPRWENEETTTG